MYIAIEGVKGVGKSTLIEKISDHFLFKKVDLVLVCPTKPIRKNSIYELIFSKFPILTRFDWVKELIYIRRSNLVGKTTDWNAPFILGDRSIATSYASRLWKYTDPNKQIRRIDKKETLLPGPDYIIYLQADVQSIISRIQYRSHRKYGHEDESREKIELTLKGYEYLIQNKPSRLRHTHWIVLDASQDKESICEKVIGIIENLIN